MILELWKVGWVMASGEPTEDYVAGKSFDKIVEIVRRDRGYNINILKVTKIGEVHIEERMIT